MKNGILRNGQKEKMMATAANEKPALKLEVEPREMIYLYDVTDENVELFKRLSFALANHSPVEIDGRAVFIDSFRADEIQVSRPMPTRHQVRIVCVPLKNLIAP